MPVGVPDDPPHGPGFVQVPMSRAGQHPNRRVAPFRLHGVRGLVGVVAAASAVGLVLVQARRTIGGLTGDVLGACVEVALTAYLLAEAADPIPG